MLEAVGSKEFAKAVADVYPKVLLRGLASTRIGFQLVPRLRPPAATLSVYRFTL